MKTDNLNQPGERTHGVVRGHIGRVRAGSAGITFEDSVTTATGVVDLLVVGGTITDNDDGTAVLTIETGITHVDDPDPGTPEVQVETSQGTGMTIPVPADVVNGTFMLMAIWKDDDVLPAVSVVATGWTQIGTDNAYTYFWRIADGEPLSYSVTYGPTNIRAIGVIVGIPDIDTTNPIASFNYDSGGSAGLSVPQGTYYMLAGTEVNSGAVTFTAPTDWTILAQGETGGSYPNTLHESGVLAGRVFTGSSLAGPVTFGSNHGTWDAGALIALKKAGPLDSMVTDISELDRTKSSINVSHLVTGEPFLLIAHRGDINPVDGFPEDTLAAHRSAMVRGADGTEFGVQRDADGTWQAFHDTTVDRTTTGTGAVSSKTTAQMAALVIDGVYGYDAGRHGSSYHPATVDEVLDAILPYDPVIVFNMKELTVAACTAFAEYVVAREIAERSIILCSLVTGGPEAVKAVNPNILTDSLDLALYEQDSVTDAAFVQALEPVPVYAYHDSSDATWDDDESPDIAALFSYGVRAYLTNDLPNALLIRNDVVLHTNAEIDAHLADTTDAHDASAVSFTPTGTISSTDVQSAIAEVAAEAAAAASGIGALLIASDHSSPIVFADILQASDGDDFLYASTP